MIAEPRTDGPLGLRRRPLARGCVLPWVLSWTGAALGILALPGPSRAAGVSAPKQDAATPGQSAHEAGLAAYERGEYREAMRQFERAYELDGHPGDLYGWAQAARGAGDCETAIALYRRFIDLGMAGDSRAAAEQNEARCREQLEQQRAEEAAKEPEPELEPVPPAPVPAETPDPAPDRPRPDALGVSLLSIGSAGVVAGAVLLGVGEAQRAVQDEVDDYQRFDALDGTVDRLHIAGGVVLGIGVSLAVAGVVRLVVRRSRRRRAASHVSARWAFGFGTSAAPHLAWHAR